MHAVLDNDRKYWCKNAFLGRVQRNQECGKSVGAIVIFHRCLVRRNHVTVSAVCPLLSHILNTILLVNSEDSSIVSHIEIKIKEDLGCWYVHLLQSLLDKCSYLDPRFRWKHVANQEEVTYQVKIEVVEMLQQNDAHDVAAEVEVAVSETTGIPKQKKMKAKVLFYSIV